MDVSFPLNQTSHELLTPGETLVVPQEQPTQVGPLQEQKRSLLVRLYGQKNTVFAISVFLFVVLGALVGVLLVKNNQDVRQQAITCREPESDIIDPAQRKFLCEHNMPCAYINGSCVSASAPLPSP